MEVISSSAKAEFQELVSRLASNNPPASQPRQGVIDAKRRLQEKREARAARRAQAANGNGGGNNVGGNGGGGGNGGAGGGNNAGDHAQPNASADRLKVGIWAFVALLVVSAVSLAANHYLADLSVSLDAKDTANKRERLQLENEKLTFEERRDALKSRGNGKAQQPPQAREAFIAARIQALIDRCGQKANPAITYQLEVGCHFFKVEGTQAARFTVVSSHRVYTIERAGNGTPVVITAANGSFCEDSEAKSCSEWIQGNFRSGENLGIVAKPGGGFILNIARR